MSLVTYCSIKMHLMKVMDDRVLGFQKSLKPCYSCSLLCLGFYNTFSKMDVYNTLSKMDIEIDLHRERVTISIHIYNFSMLPIKSLNVPESRRRQKWSTFSRQGFLLSRQSECPLIFCNRVQSLLKINIPAEQCSCVVT